MGVAGPPEDAVPGAPPGEAAAAPDDPVSAFLPRPFFHDDGGHWLTRAAIVRGLGFVYSVAFFSLYRQMDGLVGSHGLLPATAFLAAVKRAVGATAFVEMPTLFWLGCSDLVLHVACLAGLVLSLLAFAGRANAWTMAAIWVVYSSFLPVGQVFYGYGWELLLVEAGFLAVFLAPPRRFDEFSPPAPPIAVIWLFRWLAFRVMLGAGLIKLRGDPCWVNLTCLVYHYETQPNPNPLSPYFHALPPFAHEVGALFNHLVELIAPWGLFGPRRFRYAAGALIVAFQIILILSGNLSFLNWLTIVVALAAFDDAAFQRLFPGRLRAAVKERIARVPSAPQSRSRRITLRALVAGVAFLSIFPVVNMISPEQSMNRSFDPLHLVNTYGAFGSVGRERHEVVLEGTWDDPLAGDARYQEYEFPCKPGDPRRRPCLVSPYHYRLDWQMWFAGLSDAAHEPWILKLVYELLRENPAVTALLAKDPFRGRPPRYVRALLYRYRFARPGSGVVWRRELIGEYLRPLSLDDAELVGFVRRHFPGK